MQGPSSAIWTGLFCKEVNIGQQREDANEKLMLNHAARRPRTCMNHDRAARAAVDKGGSDSSDADLTRSRTALFNDIKRRLRRRVQGRVALAARVARPRAPARAPARPAPARRRSAIGYADMHITYNEYRHRVPYPSPRFHPGTDPAVPVPARRWAARVDTASAALGSSSCGARASRVGVGRTGGRAGGRRGAGAGRTGHRPPGPRRARPRGPPGGGARRGPGPSRSPIEP